MMEINQNNDDERKPAALNAEDAASSSEATASESNRRRLSSLPVEDQQQQEEEDDDHEETVASFARMSRSERKRFREKRRRFLANKGFDELRDLLDRVAPSERGTKRDTHMNRTELITTTVQVVERLHLENVSLKRERDANYCAAVDAAASRRSQLPVAAAGEERFYTSSSRGQGHQTQQPQRHRREPPADQDETSNDSLSGLIVPGMFSLEDDPDPSSPYPYPYQQHHNPHSEGAPRQTRQSYQFQPPPPSSQYLPRQHHHASSHRPASPWRHYAAHTAPNVYGQQPPPSPGYDHYRFSPYRNAISSTNRSVQTHESVEGQSSPSTEQHPENR